LGKYLRNDLFCMEWDLKPQLSYLSVVIVATAGHVTYQPIEVLEGELVNQWLKSTEHCAVITDHGASGPKCFIMLTYSQRFSLFMPKPAFCCALAKTLCFCSSDVIKAMDYYLRCFLCSAHWRLCGVSVTF